MDNLAHSLLGLAMAQAGPARRWGKGATAALVIASNAADVDVLLAAPHGALAALVRRGPTHSAFGGPLLCFLTAALLKLVYRRQRFGVLLGLCAAGWAGHVAFDLLNSYGVMLLAPFSRARWELGCVFIVDLAVWGILLAPTVLSLVPPGPLAAGWTNRERQARIALAGLCGYLLACGTLREASVRALERATAGDAGVSCRYVFPEPFGPHRFRGVARRPGEWEVFLVRPLSGSVEPVRRVPTAASSSPAVSAALATRGGRLLETFLAAPVWTVSPDRVEVYDLRFSSVLLDWREPPFAFSFSRGPGGRVAEPVRRRR
jgi:membrane-bound metal-dependent hydrolase YbcI (DUF457 family)